MMHRKTTIDVLIQMERDIVNKYSRFADITSSEEEMVFCQDLRNKHSLHIAVLEKYLGR
jgi:hypothetical protein